MGFTYHRDMPAWIPEYAPVVITIMHFVGASSVTLHAILRKRESHSVLAWVGLAWLAPVLGSILYLIFGINRIQRTAVSLNLKEAWSHIPDPTPSVEDTARAARFLEAYPNLEGLSHLGRAITQSPLLPGNRITPLLHGDETYPAMIEAIDGAASCVALLSYIFDNDRAGQLFEAALLRARERGVVVRVLIDHVGSRYSKPSMAVRLAAGGIEVATFLKTGLGMSRYANLRNHRKILVVDGQTGFTGGTNIREGHCLGWDPKVPVQCMHFKIEGPVVAELQKAFAIDWAFTTSELLTKEPWFPQLHRCGTVFARGVPDGPDEDLDKMSEIINGALASASQQVRIVTPYFIPDTVILKALQVTAMRGVDVDIVLPERNNIPLVDWAAVPLFEPLIEKGCRIHLSPPPFDHTKLFVVDGVWSLIGSTNWDARSLRLNFEYNLECYNADLADSLNRVIDKKIGEARPVSLESLRNRSLPIRIRDGLAHLLAPYL